GAHLGQLDGEGGDAFLVGLTGGQRLGGVPGGALVAVEQGGERATLRFADGGGGGQAGDQLAPAEGGVHLRDGPRVLGGAVVDEDGDGVVAELQVHGDAVVRLGVRCAAGDRDRDAVTGGDGVDGDGLQAPVRRAGVLRHLGVEGGLETSDLIDDQVCQSARAARLGRGGAWVWCGDCAGGCQGETAGEG